MAAAQLNVAPAEIVFAGGRVAARANPDNALPFARLAASRSLGPGHDPLRARSDRSARRCSGRRRNLPRRPTPMKSTARCVTVSFSISAASRSIKCPAPCALIATSPCTIADASCIRRWWQGRSAAVLRTRSAPPCTRNTPTRPTAAFSPAPLPIICCRPRWRCRSRLSYTASRHRPFTPLGAKGVGEGNCMSTPVCIANAIADALDLAALDLPATPAKLAAHVHGAEPERARQSRRLP